MHAYRVGDLYNPKLKMPPTDQAQYNWRSGGHELVWFLDRPEMRETQAIVKGRAEFALFVSEDLLLLCSRFGSMPWSDSPHSIHLVPESERGLPDPGDEGGEKRQSLFVAVVDRASGRIATSLRLVTFSPEFTAALHDAIRAQAARPWPGNSEYDRQLAALYQRYPSPDGLVRDAVARCTGGQP